MKPSTKSSQRLNEHLFVVVAGQIDPHTGKFDVSTAEFHGTAFALASTLFITAHHVYAAAAASGKHVAVGNFMAPGQEGSVVVDADQFPSVDLTIMKCPALPSPPTFLYRFQPMDYLQDVAACGFPFGFTLLPGNPPQPLGILRSFRGNIVTRRGLDALPAVPPGYETSFPAPPGLSGAPLLSIEGEPRVRGVIVGEFSANTTTTHQPMTLGTAVDIEVLLTLDSKFVGGSVAENLFKKKRLPKYSGEP